MLSTAQSRPSLAARRARLPLPRPAWFLLLPILLVAGCAPTPERTDMAPSPVLTKEEAPDLVEEQEPLPDDERLERAQELAHEAAYADDEARINMQLEAAEHYTEGGETELAGRLLNALSQEDLTAQQNRQWRILTAGLELVLRHPQDTLNLLDDLPDDSTTPTQNEAIHRLRARAHSALGNAIEVARARVALDDYLDRTARVDNRRAIWAALQRPRESQLASMVTESGDTFGGWVELARLNKAHQVRPDQLDWLLDGWAVRYPEHPAADLIVPRLLNRERDEFNYPDTVAVLLPLSGRFARAGNAIADSLLAAYYDSRQQGLHNGVELNILDTEGADPDDLIRTAVDEGAQAIVGPLRREVIVDLATAMASGFEPGIPILALNDIELDSPPSGLYRFGLNPEHEARAVAERMWRDGHTRVVMLHPRSDWGARVQTAFSDYWQELGGELLDHQQYGEEAINLSLPIRRVLAVDASEQRHRDLRQRISARLHFEPRRRKDMEAIFLAGFPETARQIPPQLRFYDAGELPVYGTSHIFSGKRDADMDSDLQGVQFCDMPWVLARNESTLQRRHQQVNEILDPSTELLRLHAFGQDAWDLLPRLDLLTEQRHERMDGATGTLYIDDQNRVGRELLWGVFDRGLPTAMDHMEE